MIYKNGGWVVGGWWLSVCFLSSFLSWCFLSHSFFDLSWKKRKREKESFFILNFFVYEENPFLCFFQIAWINLLSYELNLLSIQNQLHLY